MQSMSMGKHSLNTGTYGLSTGIRRGILRKPKVVTEVGASLNKILSICFVCFQKRTAHFTKSGGQWSTLIPKRWASYSLDQSVLLSPTFVAKPVDMGSIA